MVGGFVEQQKVLVGAKQTGQAHSVALPHGQVLQPAGVIRDRAEGFQ